MWLSNKAAQNLRYLASLILRPYSNARLAVTVGGKIERRTLKLCNLTNMVSHINKGIPIQLICETNLNFNLLGQCSNNVCPPRFPNLPNVF